jgi:hypothetical protein
LGSGRGKKEDRRGRVNREGRVERNRRENGGKEANTEDEVVDTSHSLIKEEGKEKNKNT